jgi:hypothetical protein
MNTKKILLSVSTFVAIGIIGLMVTNSVFAYQGNYTEKGPDYTAERHEAMEEALNSNDYDTWANLMQNKGRVTQVINQDNFDKFVQAHILADQGKYTEANAIREELGLRTSNGQKPGSVSGSGFGQGMRRGQI